MPKRKETPPARADRPLSQTFEEIYATYGERMLTLLYRFTNNEESARDLLQDVFLAVYQNLDSFQQRSDIATWIHRIAVNRALNHIKRERRTLWFNMLDEGIATLLQKERIETRGSHAGDPPGPDRLMEAREFSEMVEEAVRSLPVKYRAPFLLFREGEMTNAEIASALNLSVSAVETRIHRAKKMLIRKLGPHL